MSKQINFLLFIILLISTMPLPWAEALGIGPPSFELDLQMDGSNSTTVYLLSDGLEGELVIGTEKLPFRVEPSKINMSKDDHYRPVELTFYGNETLEPGVYEGMVSFIASTGGFVSLGIKIRVKINMLEASPEIQEEEPERPVAAESEEEPEAETEQESEPEPEYTWMAESGVPLEGEQEASEEEPEPESQEMNYAPYVMGVAAVAALVSVAIWWKRR